jgi:hypothetical protein
MSPECTSLSSVRLLIARYSDASSRVSNERASGVHCVGRESAKVMKLLLSIHVVDVSLAAHPLPEVLTLVAAPTEHSDVFAPFATESCVRPVVDGELPPATALLAASAGSEIQCRRRSRQSGEMMYSW